jgi:hypothetical protein
MWASRLAAKIVWCGSNDVLTCARGFTKVSATTKGKTMTGEKKAYYSGKNAANWGDKPDPPKNKVLMNSYLRGYRQACSEASLDADIEWEE